MLRSVRKEVLYLGGTELDVRAALNNALLIFDRNVNAGKYDSSLCKVNTYIVAIAKKLFYTEKRSELRRDKAHNRSAEAHVFETDVNPYVAFNRKHREELLQLAMKKTGEKCHQALTLYSLNYSMAEIAQEMNYKSSNSAKMAVMDCRKKLNEYLTENPELVAELLDS
ncbi:MAG: hypothetical protein R2778_13265 [Saprospiraceae bacterium]